MTCQLDRFSKEARKAGIRLEFQLRKLSSISISKLSAQLVALPFILKRSSFSFYLSFCDLLLLTLLEGYGHGHGSDRGGQDMNLLNCIDKFKGLLG
jgi:hypothetical protein